MKNAVVLASYPPKLSEIEGDKSIGITSNQDLKRIEFANQDGSRVGIGYNDSKILHVESINGVINVKQINIKK